MIPNRGVSDTTAVALAVAVTEAVVVGVSDTTAVALAVAVTEAVPVGVVDSLFCGTELTEEGSFVEAYEVGESASKRFIPRASAASSFSRRREHKSTEVTPEIGKSGTEALMASSDRRSSS